jgi:hypothetical protein
LRIHIQFPILIPQALTWCERLHLLRHREALWFVCWRLGVYP